MNLISNREKILKSIMNELNISRSESKTVIIAVINGGSTYKSSIAKKFKDNIFKNIKTICDKPEYETILNESISKIKTEDLNTFKDNRYGKCISKILQVIENDMLEHYIQFFYDNNLINKINLNGKEYYQTSLIFDGLQIFNSPSFNENILIQCQEYTFKHTGYNISLITKPFDNPLNLPSNYNELVDDIPAITNSLRIGLEHFKNTNRTIIDNCIDTQTHYDVAVLFFKLLKGKIYCENEKSWYYCNSNNIWKYNNTPMLLDAIIPVIGPELFSLIEKEYVIKGMEETDKDKQKKLLKLSEKCAKLIICMKLSPFRNNVIKGNYSLYIKENFKEKNLDSKTHLFAFNDKVFDFNLKPENKNLSINDFIRYIRPDDYIFTNTGYSFPPECYEEDTQFLNQYFDDLFPVIDSVDDEKNQIKLNEGKKDYVLNIIATSLNGANNEQSVFFHTGRGSNSKTTLFSLIEKVFGDYFQSLSSETFTDKMRANACNDLYKLFGKRFTTFQEPDDTNGTQLQTSTLKIFGDNDSVKINGNQKYKDPIQFKNQSTLHGAMNNKPTLSGVDGGIRRRVKIIEYTTQFVDKDKIYDPDYQKPIDPNFMKLIGTDNVRDAFVIILFNQWINKIKDIKQIKIPDCVMKASSDYCDDCDTVMKFINTKYIITRDTVDKIKPSILYIQYKNFVKNETSEQPLTDKKFKESLCNINGIVYGKVKGLQYYKGIKEREDDSNETESLKPVGPEPKTKTIAKNYDSDSDSEIDDEKILSKYR